MKISSRTLIPLFVPGSVHIGSASRDDCGRMFPDKFRVSSFLNRFPHDTLIYSIMNITVESLARFLVPTESSESGLKCIDVLRLL